MQDKADENPYEAARFTATPYPAEPNRALTRLFVLVVWLISIAWAIFQIAYQATRFSEHPVASVVSIATAFTISAVLFGGGLYVLWDMQRMRSE